MSNITRHSFVVSQSFPSLKDGNDRTVVAEVFLAMFNCNELPVRPHILVEVDVVHSCSIPAEILTEQRPLYLSERSLLAICLAKFSQVFVFIFVFLFLFLLVFVSLYLSLYLYV